MLWPPRTKLQKYFVFQMIAAKNMCRNGTKRSLPTPFPNSSKRDKRRGRMGDVGGDYHPCFAAIRTEISSFLFLLR